MPDELETTTFIAAEDRFLIFPLGHYNTRTSPTANILIDFHAMLERAVANTGVTPVFDLRGLECYYNDIDTFIKSLGGSVPHVLLGDQQIAAGWSEELQDRGLITIPTRGTAISGHALSLHDYVLTGDNGSYNDVAAEVLPNDEYLKLRDPDEWGYDFVCNELADFVRSIHQHSLLVEFAMVLEGDQLTLSPYHGHAIHSIENGNKEVLVGRPAAIAKKTAAVFTTEISEFERLINSPDTHERHLQAFLEQHPNFLRGLNYENIYPQLVLERDGQGPLKPDFILEPYADSFCDILDIKLPSQNLIVGKKDRATLAAGLHEVAAQLREYAAYFEERKYQKFVQDTYGIRLYRPRLIAVVGRDMKQMNDQQFRRAMTMYENLQIMTFDELLRHARRRLLI